MNKYIIEQWRVKKGTVFLIILGFFVGSLFLSIGISIAKENYNYAIDQTSGNPDKQLGISVTAKKNTTRELVKIIHSCADYGEIQVLNMDPVTMRTNGEESLYQPIIVCGNEIKGWHIPIIDGKYFTANNYKNERKNIIVGKSIAKKLGLSIGDRVYVQQNKYKVIGICGRANRTTQWDQVFYIRDENLIRPGENLYLLLKDGKSNFLSDKNNVINFARKNHANIDFEELESTTDYSSFKNSVCITIVSTVVIFLVAIINIVNLMLYWIMDRKKDMGIWKALGATNWYIIKWTFIEVLFMTVGGALLAIVFQYLLSIVLKGVLLQYNLYISISWVNYIFAIVIACIAGTIAAIAPALKTIHIQPSEVMKAE